MSTFLSPLSRINLHMSCGDETWHDVAFCFIPGANPTTCEFTHNNKASVVGDYSVFSKVEEIIFVFKAQ
jgi:hypothetical protein